MVELLYAALHSPLGIVVITNGEVERARQQLYALKRKLSDPDLDQIAICISPTNPGADLWLVKKAPSNAP